MRVEELKELLCDCYEDMEVVVDTDNIFSQAAEVVGIDLDEIGNMAIIRIKG